MSVPTPSFSIKVLGYCELTEAEILSRFESQGPSGLQNLRGEYTLILERPDELVVVNSPFGVLHYFYTVQNGKIYHSDRLTEILKSSGLNWEWNWQALGDLCQLENLTDNVSLHKEIRKVPSGAILHFKEGSLSLSHNLWLDSVQKESPDPAGALKAFNDEAAYWAGDKPFLSLSGGFDSRVILSSLLKQGIKPNLVTMGTEASSDVRVTQQIAKKFGLKQEIIPISLDDFFTHAKDVSELTNGTKTAWHWHTYIYPQKAGIGPENTFFVGTLGEFARSYYFDKGFLGQVADLMPYAAVLNFWKLKLRRNWTFLDDELPGLAPEFAVQLNNSGRSDRAARIAEHSHRKFLSGMSRFYLEQRLPNFYANGVKMYLASAGWKSPFHSREWVNKIWSLGNNWKLGSNWHRYAIHQNFPQLLDFQEENGRAEGKMLPKAPFLYWAPFMKRIPYVSYNLSGEWYQSERIRNFIMDNLSDIEDIIQKDTVTKIVQQHQGGIDRTRTLAFLLTMIYWKQCVS